VPGHAAFHQAAQRREFLGKVPALERSGLIQRIDLLLDQRQVMDGIEDNVFPVPAPRITGNDLATAAEHHLIDIAPNPDVLMAVGDRHGIVLGLVADERLGRHNSAGLVAGVKRRRRQGTHGIQVSLKPFADCLALAPQLVVLAFAVLLFQKDIERIPCRKLRDRHHEVAPGVADKALDIPFVVAFARTPIAIPDQVVGQEAAEQRRPLACSVERDLVSVVRVWSSEFTSTKAHTAYFYLTTHTEHGLLSCDLILEFISNKSLQRSPIFPLGRFETPCISRFAALRIC